MASDEALIGVRSATHSVATGRRPGNESMRGEAKPEASSGSAEFRGLERPA